jgi:hypothetical protein
VGEVVSQIFRYEVPVDDQWHEISSSPALHVACRRLDVVEFWAYPVLDDTPARKYRVFGTGQDIDEGTQYVGTALAPGGGLVWHLAAKW